MCKHTRLLGWVKEGCDEVHIYGQTTAITLKESPSIIVNGNCIMRGCLLTLIGKNRIVWAASPTMSVVKHNNKEKHMKKCISLQWLWNNCCIRREHIGHEIDHHVYCVYPLHNHMVMYVNVRRRPHKSTCASCILYFRGRWLLELYIFRPDPSESNKYMLARDVTENTKLPDDQMSPGLSGDNAANAGWALLTHYGSLARKFSMHKCCSSFY